MSDVTRFTDRLERVVSMMGRAVEVAFLAVLLVAILCVIVIMAAGTYGVLHKGDDFGFNDGGGGGDVIIPLGSL